MNKSPEELCIELAKSQDYLNIISRTGSLTESEKALKKTINGLLLESVKKNSTFRMSSHYTQDEQIRCYLEERSLFFSDRFFETVDKEVAKHLPLLYRTFKPIEYL